MVEHVEVPASKPEDLSSISGCHMETANSHELSFDLHMCVLVINVIKM